MVEQKKVSLTIETDWLTFDYVDRLSKTIETIHQSIDGINKQTAQRFEELREWEFVDPTEWLEDIEDDLEALRTQIKQQETNAKTETDELMTKQATILSELTTMKAEQNADNEKSAQLLEKLVNNAQQVEAQLQKLVTNEAYNELNKKIELYESNVSKLLEAQQQQIAHQQQQLTECLDQLEKSREEKFEHLEKQFEQKLEQATEQIVGRLIEQLQLAPQQAFVKPQQDVGGGNDEEE